MSDHPLVSAVPGMSGPMHQADARLVGMCSSHQIGSASLQGCTFPEWHCFHCYCADTAPPLHLQVNKLDWIVFNAAWLGVMFAGVEIGLAIAIGTSIVLVLYKTGFPHMAVLGRLPQTTVYRWAGRSLPELRFLLSAAAVTCCLSAGGY